MEYRMSDLTSFWKSLCAIAITQMTFEASSWAAGREIMAKIAVVARTSMVNAIFLFIPAES